MDENWCRHVWAITKVIFNYTGSPGEIIPQKVLGGLLFLTHTVVTTYMYAPHDRE